jgi:protocatechuate 3,4-dioxygenase beta subunit
MVFLVPREDQLPHRGKKFPFVAGTDRWPLVLQPLWPGKYEARVYGSAFGPSASTKFEVLDGRSGPVTIVLSRGLTMAGTVSDAGGHALADAGVHLFADHTTPLQEGTCYTVQGVRSLVPPLTLHGTPTASTRTDRDGRYQIQGLTAGPYWVRVEAAGMAPHQEHLIFTESDTLDAVLDVMARLTAEVVDDEGAPLPGAEVAIAGRAHVAQQIQADRAGRFTIDLPADEYFLEGQVAKPGTAKPTGYSSSSVSKDDPFADRAPTLVLRAGEHASLRLVVSCSAAVEGKLGSPTCALVVGLMPVSSPADRLSLFGFRREMPTVADADGHFRIGSLRPGSYRLFVGDSEDCLYASEPFPLEEKATRAFDLRFELASLSFQVMHAGAGVSGALVIVKPDQEDLETPPSIRLSLERRRDTDLNGRGRIASLPTGRYRVTASKQGFTTSSLVVAVPATRDLTIELPR